MSRIIEFRTSAQKAERQSAQGKTCAFVKIGGRATAARSFSPALTA